MGLHGQTGSRTLRRVSRSADRAAADDDARPGPAWRDAIEAHAYCLVTPRAHCHVNLDLGQPLPAPVRVG